MKIPEPEYAQNVIVGVIFHNTFAWYVTDKMYWYMDYTIYNRALFAHGYTKFVSDDYSWRFNIPIIDENTAEDFLFHIQNYRIATSALTEMMLVQRQMYEKYASLNSLEYYNDILDFSPCF